MNVNPARAVPIFSVYMDPDVVVEAPGTSFNVTIKIANVPDLWSWEFNITWATTLLQFELFMAADFLSSAGATFFTTDLSGVIAGKGWIFGGETRTGGTQEASGFGDLAIIGFTVKAGASGECWIHFQDSLLVRLNPAGQVETIPTSEYELFDSKFKYPVTSWIPGDVNQDGKVNIMDLAMIGVKFGQTGTGGWIPEDVIPNGVIDIGDLALCARNYGKYV